MGSFEQSKETTAVTPNADKAALEEIKQDLELKNNAIKALEEHVNDKPKDGAEVKLGDKGLEIESLDKNFKMAIGGRLQVDAQVNMNDHQGSRVLSGAASHQPLNDGIGVRRGRMHMEGTLYKDYDFKFEYDFARGNGSTAAGITDAWIEYTGFKPFSVTIGQFKEPFSLESVTSNRFLTFAERSFANNAFVEFANPYLLGLSAQSYGDRYSARVAFQAEPIGGGNYNANTSTNSNGNANRNGQSGNPTYGVTGRATFLPYFESKTELLHVGASGSYRVVNNTNNGVAAGSAVSGNGAAAGAPTAMQFASQVTNVDRTNWANTGALTGGCSASGVCTRKLENYYRVGTEVAGVYGPFSFQSEYMLTQLNGQGYDSNDMLQGYYVFGSYFLTGESRTYDSKKGVFGRQKPNKNFSFANGGWGAWELAARWDTLDMNTKHVTGGRLESGTVALNWYVNPHVRLMVDYEHVFTNKYIQQPGGPALATGTNNAMNTNGQHPDVMMVRTQLDW
jgi:phosphate-selective porin OprO/OprP